MSSAQPQTFLRPPAELVYARELDALAANDQGPKPIGWKLSPRFVRTFIVGSDGQTLAHEWEGKKVKTAITRKFYGDDVLVERDFISLAGNRGWLLFFELGTAKRILSEQIA